MMKAIAAVTTFCAALSLLSLPVSAQEYPTKQPIKIVVPAAAGGLTDVLGRVTAEFLQRRLKQAVVVENKPGASGTIGADYVNKAAPDGYTLFLANTELAVVPAVRDNLPYKFDDFTFLVRGFTVQPLLLVGPKATVSTVPDLVALMKASPGKIRYATSGVGANGHLGTAAFEASAGVKGVHVPYPGIAPAYQDLLAGNVDFTASGTPPFPDGLKVIASIGTKRSPAYPDKPTLEESGIKNATWDANFGVLAPPNLPKPIADRLISELKAIFSDPEAIEKYKSTVKVAPETSPLVGDDYKKQTIKDYENWKISAEREHIKVQQ
jgi:tripartite-type tricarboxylate transporter receptor subunit TctC